ncbi:MAG: hypothetical protein GX999_08875 [Bacteroidales bacterium]|nr:hypothetical protein [Bacteroidales bacterium]
MTMFIRLLIISALILFLVFILLGIRILIKPGGQFPETHVGHNKEMKKLGIRCAQHQDLGCKPVEGSASCMNCEKKF